MPSGKGSAACSLCALSCAGEWRRQHGAPGLDSTPTKFPFTLQQMGVFKAYAVAQSLDEAAAALGMTKSNVMMTLSILEREFDAELVEQVLASALPTRSLGSAWMPW